MSSPARRTTADLVAELQEAAEDRSHAALVVGFDHRTEFVWADDPDALHVLNAHVMNGGDPLGFVTGQQDGVGSTAVHARTLVEYEDEEWVEKYLITLLAEVRRRAAENGIETGPITDDKTGTGD
jgi:hypothetical protein